MRARRQVSADRRAQEVHERADQEREVDDLADEPPDAALFVAALGRCTVLCLRGMLRLSFGRRCGVPAGCAAGAVAPRDDAAKATGDATKAKAAANANARTPLAPQLTSGRLRAGSRGRETSVRNSGGLATENALRDRGGNRVGVVLDAGAGSGGVLLQARVRLC